MQNSVFRMKQTSVQNQASVVASALSGLGELTGEEVELVLQQLDTSGLSRLLVTDERSLVLYDSSETQSCQGKYALLGELTQALSGKDVFRSAYSSDAFRSRAAVPVMYHGVIIGGVYVYEYDSEQAVLVASLERNLGQISLVILLMAVAICIAISWSLSRRIDLLLTGILKFGETDRAEKVAVGGKDEIAVLAEEFNNLTDRLTVTEEVRRRFVSDASHELKTPLASIRLLTDSILQTEGMDRETMRDFVSDIGTEAERLSRMTEKLLALTRLDASAETPVEVVDLCYPAERVTHMLQPLAESRQVRVELVPSEGCTVLGNSDDLYQIVFNLAENAIKYNVIGGWVRLTLSAGEETVTLWVEDSGIGIPEGECDKVFDRFYRVDKARSREAGGAGLGLSIVHDMVTRYQGHITVTPRLGGGSVFQVVFPREVTE
jgi:signal transduction histidine kinase